MQPIQIVIDTNVLVAAYRSRHGASYQLVSRLGDPRFQVNVSTTLLFEYEEKLKHETVLDGTRDFAKQDRFLNFLATIANRRSIYFGFRAESIDAHDQFIVDLAVASGARFIVTFNQKHFVVMRKYGLYAIRPAEFLRILEELT